MEKAELKKKTKNSQKMNELLEKLLKGEDIYETVATSRGTFRMKYPRPRVLRSIQILLAERFPNVDLNKLSVQTVRNYEVYATLDVIIVEAPDWWEKMNTSEDCPDDELILELYRRYLRFYSKIQSRIQSTRGVSRRSSKASTGGDKEKTVDTGAFSNIAHGQEV